MTKTFRFLCATAALALFLPMYADSDVEWLEKYIDYGVIKEANGPATRTARFVNRGKEPIAVTGIRPSCGCTAANADKDVALPGDTVTISVTYDPSGRPGRIEKTTRVFLGEHYSITLPMSGSVLATPATLSSMYPYSHGPLAISSETALLGDMKKGEARHAFINLYNQSADSVKIDWKDTPRCLSIDASPRVLGPGDIGVISLFYNSRDDNRMADVVTPVEIIAAGTDGAPVETITISAQGKVIPDAATMTPEQRANPAVIYAAPERLDIGSINSPKIAEFTFNIQNQGKSPLQIYSVASQQEGLRITKYPESLKTDKSGKITGTLDIDKVQQGPFRVMMEVISNDPLHPVTTLFIVGEKYY